VGPIGTFSSIIYASLQISQIKSDQAVDVAKVR
jgi:hypothetical protein